jgi:hypothetical protein
MKKARIGALLILAAAAGCYTPYQRMGFRGGYDEYPLDADTYVVSAQGNGYTSSERVGMYVHYRCAELAVETGHDFREPRFDGAVYNAGPLIYLDDRPRIRLWQYRLRNSAEPHDLHSRSDNDVREARSVSDDPPDLGRAAGRRLRRARSDAAIGASHRRTATRRKAWDRRGRASEHQL